MSLRGTWLSVFDLRQLVEFVSELNALDKKGHGHISQAEVVLPDGGIVTIVASDDGYRVAEVKA